MKFNVFKKVNNTTENHEGAQSFKMTSEYELYTAVVTSGLNPSFYEKENDRLDRILTLIVNCDLVFVVKLAVYARTSMNLRTIPQVIMVELAKMYSGDSLISAGVNGVIRRTDEITEMLAYYQITNKRSGTKKLGRLSKQIQKGISLSFNKFDEYQFAKYNRKTEVELRDALFLVHPKASKEGQQAIFDKIATNSLAVPYTWETELSALGQQKFKNDSVKAKAVMLKWQELIDSGKLGYMALLRNLRNILEARVGFTYVEKVCAYLSDPYQVKNSKQLPFRYLAAYRELKEVNNGLVPMVLDALNVAVTHSAANIKGFSANTSVVIACDVSGSMQKPISMKSKVLLYDIGLMLGMLMQSRCKNVMSGMFGDTWKVINMPSKSVLSNVTEYYKREGEVGYSTNGYLVLQDLISNRRVVDKVMMFTDLQMWDSTHSGNTIQSAWSKYKKSVAPHAKLYLFDLAGYGQTPISLRSNDVFLIAGWSDKVFEILDALDAGTTAISKIMEVEL